MRDENAGEASKRRDCEVLAADHDHLLAELDRAARGADHDQRLQEAIVGFGELMAEDCRDPQHELELLLQRVEGLARNRADGEHRAHRRHHRRGAADRAGRSDPPPCGTNELLGHLMIGEERVGDSQRVDVRPDGRLTTPHGVFERAEDGAELRRELVEVHCASLHDGIFRE